MRNGALFFLMHKFVIYCRVSSASQEEGTSLDTQERAARDLVAAQSGTVIEVIREVVSGGAYLARPGLQRAIELVEAGAASALVMLDLERFARHAAFQQLAAERIARAGGQLLFVRERFDDSPEGRLYSNIRGSVTQYYREKQRALSMEGAAAAVLRGQYPQRNRPPFGYYIVQNRDVLRGVYEPEAAGSFIIVPDRAVWVRLMYKRRAKGAILQNIADELNEANAPRQRQAPAWTAASVLNVLNNPVNKGRAAFGKKETLIDESRIAQGKSHIYTRLRPESDGNGWMFPQLSRRNYGSASPKSNENKKGPLG